VKKPRRRRRRSSRPVYRDPRGRFRYETAAEFSARWHVLLELTALETFAFNSRVRA